jgi:hypothetical protein
VAPCENYHLYFSYRHPTPDYRPRLPCASASLREYFRNSFNGFNV